MSALLCGAGGGGWSASDMLGFLALSRGDLRGSVDEGLGRRAVCVCVCVWGGGRHDASNEQMEVKQSARPVCQSRHMHAQCKGRE